MSARRDPAAEIGPGFLSRASAAVHWFVVLELLLVLTCAPALLPLLFLADGPGNALLVGLCFAPVGPALSAAVFAWRRFLTDPDLSPARHFLRGYRVNAVDVLRWWLPALAVLSLVGFTLSTVDMAGVPGWYALLLVLVAAGVLVWSAQALALSSVLALRTRDLVRLASYYLFARPSTAVGALALLVVVLGATYFGSDWVPVLLASPLALALLRTADPALRDATERFTA
ncbi:MULTISPECIES: glycosyl transferase [Actinosynnema]|uniref:glycosyl transferase n=1 Tax=Actinosynnema TaxID=40566 RepID=UPI0020A41CA7|nr:glycosyl transferase [Actinosynnema pretiosum]MCP2099033.1 Protein of unknown function, DUF624 [Actinosynnema pretiosum]